MAFFQAFCRAALLLLVCMSQVDGSTIHVTDKYSPNKDEVISHLLELQNGWQIDLHTAAPQDKIQNGFLFVRMKPEFVRSLLDNSTAQILWMEDKGEIAGYIILTEISEFFTLYVDSPIRTFAPLVNLPLFEEYLNVNQVRYIEQIAVRNNCVQKGIGSTLLEVAKLVSPDGLVAAVLTQPVLNKASCAFFSKNGFETVGFLNAIESALWPAYQTRVFFWQPSDFPEIK